MMLPVAHPLQLVLGLTTWLVWFVVLLSVACALQPPDSSPSGLIWINGALLLFTLLATGFLLYWAKQCLDTMRLPVTADPADAQNSTRRFIVWVAIHAYVFSAVATVNIGLLVVFLPPCI